MANLFIDKIFTKNMTGFSNTTLQRIRLLPYLTFPLKGDEVNPALFKFHRKAERLSFLSIYNRPMLGSDITEVFIKLEKGGVEYDLIYGAGYRPFEVSGTFVIKSDIFTIKTEAEDINLIIKVTGPGSQVGRFEINYGFEMLFDSLL